MKRTGVVALSLLLGSLLAAPVHAQSLGALFTRAKTEFSLGDYKASLATVEALDAASQQPAMASERPKLVAAISFYRAASLAALGRADEAKDEFINFVVLSPNASITSPPFPRPVLEAFQKARRAAAGRSNGLATKYAAFVVPAGWTLPADVAWVTSPLRYLLSSEQKKEFAALLSTAAREAFIADFWKALDPTPDTPANELRSEFERRVAFADAAFATDKLPGRETDRGLVFAFLGPPTYVGVSNVSADSDAMAELRGGGATTETGGNQVKGFGALTGSSRSDSLEAPYRLGTREIWYYRKGRLPDGVPFQEVDFPFITKEGYGAGVLQREPDVLQTLGQATENARSARKLK